MTQPSGRVTLLFTDIEGSTALWESHEAEMKRALARHDELLRGVIEGSGGYVFKTVGDAFCAAFSDARSAARAALEAQRALAAEPWPDPLRLRVRMALHTGVCQERDGDYFGPTVNRAARLESIAHGGQVLLSKATAGLVKERLPEGCALVDLGEHRLKDLGVPEGVFQLVAAGLDATFPPLRSLTNPELEHNLPAELTSFIGRERELAEIRRLVGESRLVTLAGPGGSGKTRIALQIAADLLDGSGDGVWFVDLSATLADEQVAGEVAAVVAVREVGTRPLLETLADALEFRDILLVLDNCEHVVDGCAKLAETLVRQCPKVWILTTSREPLAVAGERVYRVPPMGLPDVDGSTADPEALAASEAVRLFVERAKQHQPDFSLDAANADTVASICQHLDGIPLALELAAARLRSMSIEEVEGHLGQRFRLLSSRSRTASARQQTLGETLAWSYALLNDAERMVFACLAVFPSTFDLAAASAVCAEAASLDEFDVVDLIESLVDKSLLQTEQSAGALRYRMLETIAQYAAERLADGGEQAGTRAREAHAFHYLAYVERVAPHLGGADQAEWMVRMQTEYDGIRTALSFLAESPAHGPEALRMVGLLRDFWWAGLGGAQEEARELASAALAHPRAQAPTEDRARALASLGLLQITVGEVDDARVTHEEGLAIAREIDDGALASEHLSELSFVLFRLGDYVGAKESASLAVELADAAAEMDLQALARNCLGVAESADDPASAQANYLEALRLYEQLGNSRFTSMLYSNLAGHYTTAGDYAAARAMIDAAVAHAVTPDTRASAVLGLGTIALLEGDIATAESHHRDALRQLVHCGLFMWVPGALLGLAMCARASGQAERSAVLYGATDAMAEAQKIAWDTDDLSIRGDNIVALQQQMGEAFNLAYSRGSHMSRRDAIAFALDSRALDPAL